MSLAGTAQSSPTTEARQSKESDVSILVIESFASTPLGPKIVFANEKAVEETGYEESSLVGSPLGLIYDRSDLRNLIEKLPIIAGRTGFVDGSRPLSQWGLRYDALDDSPNAKGEWSDTSLYPDFQTNPQHSGTWFACCRSRFHSQEVQLHGCPHGETGSSDNFHARSGS